MNGINNNRASPPLRRPRKAGEKPPIPANLESAASGAIKRHASRNLSPGVTVEVEKAGPVTYLLASPHADEGAWQAMVCDALGTRSASTAQSFLYQLTQLCSQDYHRSDVEGEYGEWVPNERELNMILHMVAGIKPRNEMEAAQAAQMVAVHLMTMRLSARALQSGGIAVEDAALAGKLARTFVMQAEALAKLKGRKRTSKQTIIVKQEKHVHNHQHVHLSGGSNGNSKQSHEGKGDGATGQPQGCPALPSPKPLGEVVPMRRCEGEACVPVPRRAGGSTKG